MFIGFGLGIWVEGGEAGGGTPTDPTQVHWANGVGVTWGNGTKTDWSHT